MSTFYAYDHANSSVGQTHSGDQGWILPYGGTQQLLQQKTKKKKKEKEKGKRKKGKSVKKRRLARTMLFVSLTLIQPLYGRISRQLKNKKRKKKKDRKIPKKQPHQSAGFSTNQQRRRAGAGVTHSTSRRKKVRLISLPRPSRSSIISILGHLSSSSSTLPSKCSCALSYWVRLPSAAPAPCWWTPLPSPTSMGLKSSTLRSSTNSTMHLSICHALNVLSANPRTLLTRHKAHNLHW